MTERFTSITRRVSSLPANVVVLGTFARRFVTEELRVPAHRVDIVINGVPEPTEPRRKAEPGGMQRVLFLGNLSAPFAGRWQRWRVRSADTFSRQGNAP